MRLPRFLLEVMMGVGAMYLDCGSGEPGAGQFAPTEVTLREVPQANVKELVDEKLVFVDSGGVKWTATRGTWTDGASVPRLALPITDDRFQHEFLKAAVIHDAYCQDFNEKRCPGQYRTRPWKKVHRMFYEACLAGGTSALKAKLMFAAVWLCGPRWDDPDDGRRQVSKEKLTEAYVGARDWIKQRDPTIDEIVADLGRREALLVRLYKLEYGGLHALMKGDCAKAARSVREEESLLREALGGSPEDLMLLNFLGYLHKDKAMLIRDCGAEGSFDGELDEAEQTFLRIIKKDPDDPGAFNGLGSVAILRNDLTTAERHVRRALKIAPDYEAAQHDLQLIEDLKRKK